MKWRACRAAIFAPNWRAPWSTPAGISASCARWASAWKTSSCNSPAPKRRRRSRRRKSAEARRRQAMKNVLLICQKEFKSYFASPIAYLLMAFFALIFGFGFYTATRDMVRFGMQSPDDGPAAAHERQRSGHPAAAGFRQHHRAVPHPHDHHAADRRREANRHHRAADDLAGQRYARSFSESGWARCCSLCACWACPCSNIAMLFLWGKPDWKPSWWPTSGLILQGGMPAGHRNVHLHHHQEPDHRGRRHLLRRACCCGC